MIVINSSKRNQFFIHINVKELDIERSGLKNTKKPVIKRLE